MKRGGHPDFDPLNRTTEIVGTGFYDQMVVLVSCHGSLNTFRTPSAALTRLDAGGCARRVAASECTDALALMSHAIAGVPMPGHKLAVVNAAASCAA